MATASNIIHATTKTFEEQVMKSSLPVLVDFWAPWCPPCRLLKPEMEALAEKVAGRATIAFVNVDEEPQLGEQFGVSGIPALMIVKRGEVVNAWTGYTPQQAVLARLEEWME